MAGAERLGGLSDGRVPPLEQANDAQGGSTVQRKWIQLACMMLSPVLVLVLASTVCQAASTAAVSGVVRDAQGVAQMGALVQVLAADSVSVGTAFTDLYGRYRISNLVAGRYQVRATAALFVPARGSLQLTTGARATVNLTLNMISDAAIWLPAERRKADEPGDDWTWTLRSVANRPMLRMMDDGEMVSVSSSATERTTAGTIVRGSMMSGDGGFGGGGVHNVLAFDQVTADGADVILRTDLAAARTPYGRGPSTEVDAGYERRLGLGGASRLVVSYQSHPEMMGADGVTGLQVMRMATAQKIRLGDLLDFEVGGTTYTVHTVGYAVDARPFVRVTVHPGDTWALRYRLATSRDMQGFGGLDSVAEDVPAAVTSGGRPQMEHGRHQELSLSRNVGSGVVQAAVYRDSIDRATISGTGVMSDADLNGVVADTVTDSFAFLARGYRTQGVNLSWTQPLTSSMWLAADYANGSALSTRDAIAAPLKSEVLGMAAVASESATLALMGRVLHTGTKLRASYRWQPRRLVTAVNPYGAFSDQAFFNLYVRQTVRCRGLLPPGFEASVDVTNLLAQGYQPFLSADGRTLFLAQSPRTIQGGVSFTF
jgi:hypothetical protein